MAARPAKCSGAADCCEGRTNPAGGTQCDLDTAAAQQMKENRRAVVNGKEQQVGQLRLDVALVTKRHDDLIRVYTAKLKALSVPEEELTCMPFISNEVGSTVPVPQHFC